MFTGKLNYTLLDLKSIFSFTSVPDPCDLCAKMHSEEWKTPKTYAHMYEWFIQGSRCIFTK